MSDPCRLHKHNLDWDLDPRPHVMGLKVRGDVVRGDVGAKCVLEMCSLWESVVVQSEAPSLVYGSMHSTIISGVDIRLLGNGVLLSKPPCVCLYSVVQFTNAMEVKVFCKLLCIQINIYIHTHNDFSNTFCAYVFVTNNKVK